MKTVFKPKYRANGQVYQPRPLLRCPACHGLINTERKSYRRHVKTCAGTALWTLDRKFRRQLLEWLDGHPRDTKHGELRKAFGERFGLSEARATFFFEMWERGEWRVMLEFGHEHEQTVKCPFCHHRHAVRLDGPGVTQLGVGCIHHYGWVLELNKKGHRDAYLVFRRDPNGRGKRAGAPLLRGEG